MSHSKVLGGHDFGKYNIQLSKQTQIQNNLSDCSNEGKFLPPPTQSIILKDLQK